MVKHPSRRVSARLAETACVPARVAGLVVCAVMLAATLGAAQSAPRALPSDSRWAPWLGCWSPLSMQRTTQDVQVCILPTDEGTGVRMVTFAADQSVLEEPVIADGQPHGVTEANCEGTRQTRWARSGARLLTTTELRCDGQPPQQTSGLSTLVSTNQWLDIQVSGPAGRESVRIRRYVRAGENPPTPVAAAIAALPPPSALAISSLSFDDVIEAAGSVSQKTVEAWLVETEPHVTVDRRALRKMSDAHVPEPVIDLFVALAYPRRFEVRTPSGGGGGSSSLSVVAGHSGLFDFAGPWGLGYDPYMQCYAPFVGYCAYGPYDYGLYDYGWYYGGGGYVTTPLPPIGPVNPIAPGAHGHGQVVNGYGYTQVTPREAVAQSGGDGHSDRGSSSTSGSSFGGSSGGSGASPGGYSSGGGGGSSGVTAVPR